MKLTIDAKQLAELQAEMGRWPGKAQEAGNWVVQKAAQVAAREMKVDAPKAFSLLTNSISIDQESPAVAWVGPHVAYAWWVEKGRKAGGKMPPMLALKDWVRVKLKLPEGREARSAAWKIGRAIQRKGTKAHPFVEPRMASIGPLLPRWIQERLTLVFRRNP
jgi:hypothetical protein